MFIELPVYGSMAKTSSCHDTHLLAVKPEDIKMVEPDDWQPRDCCLFQDNTVHEDRPEICRVRVNGHTLMVAWDYKTAMKNIEKQLKENKEANRDENQKPPKGCGHGV